MIDRLELLFRGLRRRFSRSEWAIHLLGLPVSEGTKSEPGLILIQIDGLSRRQMEHAMEQGRLPFLKRLVQREHYQVRTFYPGMPSGTPAVQAELHYGTRCAVPSFSFFDRTARQVFTMYSPECAKEVEARLQQCGEGLLRDGSSWSNIYSGGAAGAESHFCAASMGMRELSRVRSVLRLVTFPLFHFPSLLKIAGLLVLEFFIAMSDLIYGIARGESFLLELQLVFKRVFICIALREVMSIGAKIDAARGLAIMHLNFLGYDEQAHRRGPASAFAHWSLAGIDRAIKGIYRTAHRSARRDYQVWVFSDHGQEATRIFEEVAGAKLEHVIAQALDGSKRQAAATGRSPARPARGQFTGERSIHRRFAEWFRSDVLKLFEEQPFTVTALGPVANVYLRDRGAGRTKREIAEYLVREGRVPGALICEGSGPVEWIHAQGRISLPADSLDFLPHPKALREELARDLEALCRHEFAGDLVLLGWGPDVQPMSFARERGAHAGPGPEETQGFALLPALTRLPKSRGEFIRASDLRAAALHVLGRRTLPAAKHTRHAVNRRLRIMTYNVHGCHGMDGRILPARIARVIERYHPDFVALQELDFGRVRSQRHDQPQIIAEELGMHVQFCPTVIDEDEQYGHALLGHFPMELIRTEILSSRGQTWHVEPRGALWVRVNVDGFQLNLMNTHFGLNREERLAQAEDLLGENWLGGIEPNEPVILCGDFNMFPRSRAYRALTRRLNDVQIAVKKKPALNTFSSLHPFARIDHIFVSPHFVPEHFQVPRTHLTRVASDHLPLIADLVFQEEELLDRMQESAAANEPRTVEPQPSAR